MSIPESNLLARLEQVRVALDSLAALAPPTRTYDFEGNDITDEVQYSQAQAVYEQSYTTLRSSIVAAAGPDFAAGIVLAGYEPSTISQVALVACLTNSLQIGYALKWYSS